MTPSEGGAEQTDLRRSVESLSGRLLALEDEVAIWRLVNAYGFGFDAGDSAAVARVWQEDGSYDLGSETLVGRTAIEAMVQEREPVRQSGVAHVMGIPRVIVDGDQATAWNYSRVYRQKADDAYEVWRVGVNRWSFRREEDGWRCSNRTTHLVDGSTEARDILEPSDS